MGKTVGLVFHDEPKFICPHCGKEYKNESALEKHIKEKHSEE